MLALVSLALLVEAGDDAGTTWGQRNKHVVFGDVFSLFVDRNKAPRNVSLEL